MTDPNDLHDTDNFDDTPISEPSDKFQMMMLDETHAGRRLDKVLRDFFPHLQQSDIEKSLRSKMIRLNMQKSKSDYRVISGDVLRVPVFFNTPKPKDKIIKKPEPIEQLPRDMIIYADDDILLLNKPHGLAVQGGSGTKRHLDQMLESLPKRNGFRPSSVHRLDRDTSGCLLVAKKRHIAASLGLQVRERTVDKYYIAIVAGILKQTAGIVADSLIKSEDRSKNELVRLADGDEAGAMSAQTLFMQIDKSEQHNLSMMLLKPITGRTHQLRVHMQSLDTAIIGDPKYAPDTLPVLKSNELPEKLCLHAYRLCFDHPTTHKKMDMTAPLPDHFKQIMEHYGLSIAALKNGETYQILDFLNQGLGDI